MKNIYFNVEKSIKDLQKIFENTDGADEGLRKFNQKALEEFKNLESESLKELESLKNNGEWEKFTIAFYGETGAGKSTLIECLRLFFKEPGKMDQQERFKRLYENVKNSNYVKNHENSEHAELEKLQDGAIIGDGRSDFTTKTKSYTFKHNNQSFVLLDVPGIEGKEKEVIDQIFNATRKAHAIFYVTKTPAPPQKGEERKEGTIEKIQKQLASQTEVYTLFNKPINSPRALKDGLIDENEKESLRDLNEKMKAVLGKHYKGHQIVSAQAAFYGLSSALLPETDFYKNKQKFLEIFKAEELLLKSQFKQLGKFIAGTLLENSRKKIIESNCNKALKVIEKLQKTIVTTIDRQINPTIKEIKDRQKETYSNLDRSRDKFVSKLKNSVFDAIDRFKSDLREEMYTHIDRDIEDDECEKKFEVELQQGMGKLGENIKKRFEKDEQQFRKDLQEDIEQFEERIKNSLVMLNRTHTDSGFDPNFNTHSAFDFNIDTDSGIDGLGLLVSMASLGFGIFNFWNPIGWASIGLGLVGVGKSVWSFFDSDYKKSQQRKEVDKNLDKVCGIIEEKMRNQLEDAKKGIFEKVESLKAGLNDSVVGYERMREGLIKAGEGLWHLSNNIKTRIAQ
ncbi:ancestral polypeptide [Helicobacter pylori]|uniref:GTPase n=1 Tax=Helicobacter pylori TaxID=210 RepID=UPI000958B3CA|nr:GTPase [Helicobacter pylori]BAW48545.1 ancestral polypeptide [Helicobacter pylori]